MMAWTMVLWTTKSAFVDNSYFRLHSPAGIYHVAVADNNIQVKEIVDDQWRGQMKLLRTIEFCMFCKDVSP
jgi:hypothetical protein